MNPNSKNLVIVGSVVKDLSEKRNRQIGKTLIQKILYLLSREKVSNYDFSLYHYGPYSEQLTRDIEIARENGALNIQWHCDQGYFIKPGEKIDSIISEKLDPSDKEKIDKIISTYKEFSAQDISIVATGYYIIDNFNPKNDDQIINTVIKLKPEYKDKIPEVLSNSKVIGASHAK